ncbi:hypothetical protein PsYK624_115530 [Phanerochaete sordida]|uniref:DUF6535 domain-containing protein n=1 Tax=Phanerochaete sordida TaxID=48140 RepID=A0A9P3GJF6_9APHY|nr:hypothetical protein PsYK624_115530 [Phanerochaete sordida]
MAPGTKKTMWSTGAYPINVPGAAPSNESQTNPSNIWQTMVQSVRDVDVRRVTDTKEDIDTLLVFAGLFSAVVTTFVVSSYTSLQPGANDEVVALLRQVLMQKYTQSGSALNPVNPVATVDPFEAPLWALRVNGLWFASLIVSLSTASFGMLVKQWLIEYLAMEWISPEEQLRARQYRHPGLKEWKVFEIAAMLPLLLHLSLGLFFLGLCFYTAAANKIVGRSTFPLVAGWAFFALLSVFAPLVSPRCPYKVTLLKTALRVGRGYLRSRMREPLRKMRRGIASGAQHAWTFTLWIFNAFGNLVQRPYVAYMDWANEMMDSYWYISVLNWPLLFALFPVVWILTESPSFAKGCADKGVEWLRALQADNSDEEDSLMKTKHKSHELLLSVDEVIANDGPILENMTTVLKLTHAEPSAITTFVLGCIQHRIGESDSERCIPDVEKPIRELLPLQKLTEGAWDLLIGLTGETLLSNISTSSKPVNAKDASPPVWIGNAAAVVLSQSPRPLPEHVLRLVANPTMLSQILQHARNIVVHWPRGQALDLLWIAFTASIRDATNTSSRVWDRLPRVNESVSADLCRSAVLLLLENAWRDDPNDTHHDNRTAEAILMLAFILNTSLFHLNSDYVPPQMPLEISYYQGEDILNVAGAVRLLPAKYTDVSASLGAAVRTSPSVLPGALNFYACLISNSMFPSESPLWKLIRSIESGDGGLASLALQPAMCDLWVFLLSCARSAGEEGGNGDHLHTRDFIKLCLVLALPTVPRIFGRNDPVNDWSVLVPVLTRAADDSELVAQEPSAPTREGAVPGANIALNMLQADMSTLIPASDTIVGIARRALERLPPNTLDVPPELRDVLQQLAGPTTSPPVAQSDAGSERGARSGIRINPFRRNRRQNSRLVQDPEHGGAQGGRLAQIPESGSVHSTRTGTIPPPSARATPTGQLYESPAQSQSALPTRNSSRSSALRDAGPHHAHPPPLARLSTVRSEGSAPTESEDAAGAVRSSSGDVGADKASSEEAPSNGGLHASALPTPPDEPEEQRTLGNGGSRGRSDATADLGNGNSGGSRRPRSSSKPQSSSDAPANGGS